MAVLGIAVGGALGAMARYFATLWAQEYLARGMLAGFPIGTLLVNVLGSFLLTVVVGLGMQGILSPEARLALGTGFVGAMTTFSTFELEADVLLRQGEFARVAAYVLGNLLIGYLAVMAGRYVVFRMGGAA
ncbi:MAG: fluoride efflux transporter CrcB [Bryobacterales bacterium]|nr:fluoride efflux transporter CrcB [Bryobacterales bacterium]